MKPHDGHRARLKQRYLSGGVSGLNEHELLELMLTYAIPRRDVNGLAHRMIEHFGSLEAVLNEQPELLARFGGVSMHTAILLNLFGTASRQIFFTADRKRELRMHSVMDAILVCKELLRGKRRELCCVIMLDASNGIVEEYTEQGDARAVGFDIKRMITRAVVSGASGVVIGHRHPIGGAKASEADIRLNGRIEAALGQIDVRLSEHIIVAEDDCYAMVHNVLLSEAQERGEESTLPRRIG